MTNFKLAAHSDSEEILQMMEEFYLIDHYPFDKNRNQKNLQKLIDNNQLGRLWMIHVDGVVVGYICATFGFSFEYGGQDAFIDEFFIRPDFRNQSIGKLAMKFVEEELKKLGIEAIHLEVERHNENGNRLYVKQGYKDKGRFLLTKWATL
jgi:diamine N-acetyltransferase